MLRRRELLLTALGAAIAAPALADTPSSAAPAAAPKQPDPADGPEFLKKLRRDLRPRIMVTPEIVAGMRKRLAAGDDYGKRIQAVLDEAEKVHKGGSLTLAKKHAPAQAPDWTMDRIENLAFAYLVTDDTRHAERAFIELRDMTEWSTPGYEKHQYLNIFAPMHLCGVVNDWCHPALSAEQRRVLRDAAARIGFDRAKREWAKKGAKAGEFGNGNPFHGNWDMVVASAFLVAAASFGDEADAPELAPMRDALPQAVSVLRDFALPQLRNDGFYFEGPMYWGFPMRYVTQMLATLRTARGDDMGLGDVPGMRETARFPLQVCGPTGAAFNWGDAWPGGCNNSSVGFLAARYNDPVASWHRQRATKRTSVQDLVFEAGGLPAAKSPAEAKMPLDKHYKDIYEVALMRSAWDDPDALFVGLKAGDTWGAANHTHLDLGSFVLDALGERWAVELGREGPGYPIDQGYFSMDGKNGGSRWRFYRVRAEGHNTLVLDPGGRALSMVDPDQDPRGVAPITRFETRPDRAFAITDLTSAYKHRGAGSVRRGVALRDNRSWVLVQDEVKAPGAKNGLLWFLHTKAQVELAADNRSATLTQNNKRMWACLLDPPAGAVFTVREPVPLRKFEGIRESPNPDVRKLTVEVPAAAETRLSVLFVPLKDGQQPPKDLPAVAPLDRWA